MLSDRERKVLDEIERQLAADDETLVQSFHTTPTTDRRHTWLWVLAAVFLLPVLVLVAVLPGLVFTMAIVAGLVGGVVWWMHRAWPQSDRQ